MKCTSHKRVVFWRHYKNTTSLAQPNPSCSLVNSARFFNDISHYFYRIHINPGFCGSHIYRSTDPFCSARLWGMEVISFRSPSVIRFMNKAGKNRLKIHSDLSALLYPIPGQFVHNRYICRFCHYSNRCYRDPFINYGNAIFFFYLITYRN